MIWVFAPDEEGNPAGIQRSKLKMVRAQIERLTPREREVFELVIRGKDICSRRSDEAAPGGGRSGT
jgi:hypothetical protein